MLANLMKNGELTLDQIQHVKNKDGKTVHTLKVKKLPAKPSNTAIVANHSVFGSPVKSYKDDVETFKAPSQGFYKKPIIDDGLIIEDY